MGCALHYAHARALESGCGLGAVPCWAPCGTRCAGARPKRARRHLPSRSFQLLEPHQASPVRSRPPTWSGGVCRAHCRPYTPMRRAAHAHRLLLAPVEALSWGGCRWVVCVCRWPCGNPHLQVQWRRFFAEMQPPSTCAASPPRRLPPRRRALAPDRASLWCARLGQVWPLNDHLHAIAE